MCEYVCVCVLYTHAWVLIGDLWHYFYLTGNSRSHGDKRLVLMQQTAFLANWDKDSAVHNEWKSMQFAYKDSPTNARVCVCARARK